MEREPAYAEVLGAEDIFIGVNAVDYSGYPDCRPEFISAFESMANLATAAATDDWSLATARAVDEVFDHLSQTDSPGCAIPREKYESAPSGEKAVTAMVSSRQKRSSFS